MRLKLADIFNDEMVLQRDKTVPVWGWASPGATVEVRFADQTRSAVAGPDGRWEVRLDAMPASATPRDLMVCAPTDQQQLTLHNLLVGEVWVCSGQSNMEMPVGQSNNAEQEIRDACYPLIRLFTVPRRTAEQPLTDLGEAVWQACAPAAAANFSAAAYFFGRELYRRLRVPIGLINCSWGGTVAEAWTSREALLSVPELREIVERYDSDRPNLEKIKAAYDARMRATEDSVNIGWAKGWAGVQNPEGEWKNMDLPGIWQSAGLNFSGVLWFRKALDLPAGWAGHDLQLSIGACDKSDITYFNNVQVGSVTMKDRPDAWCFLREYTVPGNLVRAGRNVIAVRVHSDKYVGGMTGPAELMCVSCPACPDIPPIPLAGIWRYIVEQNYGLVVITSPPLGPGNPNVPCCLFNAMIAPLLPLALRGAIWYQGESNADRARQYRALFPAMISDWRQRWRQGDFPFLFVQLANYMSVCDVPSESQWAELREAQTMTLRLPNTGMAVAIDIGDAKDIHPRNKQDVGRRLAMSALAGVYGMPGIIGASPLFSGARREGAFMRVRFAHADDGLVCRGPELRGFAVAGADQEFVWAQARIEGNTVVVGAPSVPDPVAVRYAWANNPVCNLYSAAGLPASPFRTDDWG